MPFIMRIFEPSDTLVILTWWFEMKNLQTINAVWTKLSFPFRIIKYFDKIVNLFIHVNFLSPNDTVSR